MALYVLNLFDLADNDLYRQYSRRSPEAISKHGGDRLERAADEPEHGLTSPTDADDRV